MLKPRRLLFLSRVALAVMVLLAGPAFAQTDPLPSWNDGPSKQSIVKFVQAVTDRANAQYVPPEARIATFDNDGTLWSEQPMYFQGFFAFDRVKALAPKHRSGRPRSPSRASSRTT